MPIAAWRRLDQTRSSLILLHPISVSWTPAENSQRGRKSRFALLQSPTTDSAHHASAQTTTPLQCAQV